MLKSVLQSPQFVQFGLFVFVFNRFYWSRALLLFISKLVLLRIFLTSASASLPSPAVLAFRVHESVICVLRISLPLLLLLVSLPLAQLFEFVFHLAPEVLCRRHCHGTRLLFLLNELLLLHYLIELV